MKQSIPLLYTMSLRITVVFFAVFFWLPSVQANPLIESVEGDIIIQRGRLRLVPVPTETTLEPRDIVHVGDGSRMVVLCTPGNSQLNRQPIRGPVRSGVRGICDNSKNLNRDFCTASSEFMEGRSTEVPYIITPRSGTILGSNIFFRWNPVDNVQTYTIRIETPSSPTEWITIWTMTTSETQLLYAGNVTLRPNVPYTLIVETETGISSVENTLDPFSRSFSVTDETEKLEAALIDIQRQPMSEEEAILATVAVYSCHDQPLINHAITYLENALSEIEGTPPLFQALGDLYYGTGLALLAEENYLRAIESANLNTYLEEWIAAQEGLARVYGRTDRVALATHALQQAELGAYYTCDQTALERIAESLTALAVLETAAEPTENESAESVAVQPLRCEVLFH